MHEKSYEKDVVNDLRRELRQRQEDRRAQELKWRMNLNFLNGNQFAEVDYRGDIGVERSRFGWECRQVYNHVAPIVETRVAKLIRTRAKFKIRRTNLDKILDDARLLASTQALHSRTLGRVPPPETTSNETANEASNETAYNATNEASTSPKATSNEAATSVKIGLDEASNEASTSPKATSNEAANFPKATSSEASSIAATSLEATSNEVSTSVKIGLDEASNIAATSLEATSTDGITHSSVANDLSDEILSSIIERHSVYKLMTTAAMWSETCGTAFYKVSWDANAGKALPDLSEILNSADVDEAVRADLVRLFDAASGKPTDKASSDAAFNDALTSITQSSSQYGSSINGALTSLAQASAQYGSSFNGALTTATQSSSQYGSSINGALTTATQASSQYGSSINGALTSETQASSQYGAKAVGNSIDKNASNAFSYPRRFDAEKNERQGSSPGCTGVSEGDISISVLSPFEIYPDCAATCLEDCASLIHAKAYPIAELRERWGVDAAAEKIEGIKSGDYATVIEKYEKPTPALPNGRLTIVAGDALVYLGDLPYLVGENGCAYPFIRQLSIETPGSFFGASVVERLIPVQRAFNTVKNRKHEFMNRLAMGVLAVEDGTVDVEELEKTGLRPGSIIVYRQGARKPEFLENSVIPMNFKEEEESLLYQFAVIGGVSDMMRTSTTTFNVTSGTALSLLLEQDDVRLSASQEHCVNALKALLKQCLRLLKQFAKTPRRGKNSSGLSFLFSGGDIISDDVIVDKDVPTNA